MAVASAGPYANNLHLTPDRQPHQLHIIKSSLLIQKYSEHCSWLTIKQKLHR